MSELFKKFLGASSQAPRNGFDKSSRQVFSMKVGTITPVHQIPFIPGTEFSLDIRHVLRTQPIQTAAFTRMTFNYDVYSVHYNDLYSGFNQYIAQTDDKQLNSVVSVQELPYFRLDSFMHKILPFAIYDYIMCIDKRLGGYDTCSIWRTGFPDISLPLEVLRALDMFGYGNSAPILDRFSGFADYVFEKYDYQAYKPSYQQLLADITTYIMDNPVIFNHADGYAEYIEMLYPQVSVNLWPALAYNKIYDQHYRNPYYDIRYVMRNSLLETTQEYYYVDLFNLDDVRGEVTDINRLIAIFAPKLHQYPKDMFNGVLPSTQFGDVSVMTDNRDFLKLEGFVSGVTKASPADVLFKSQDGNPINQGNLGVMSGDGVVQNQYNVRFNPALAISVLNQRRADALQRFNENKMRAGVRVASNFQAHFGFSPRSEQGHEAYYLGSFDGNIELNTVAATAESDEIKLGQLGANGVGVVQGDTIRFKNNTDFGVVLVLAHISKPSEYDAYGVRRENVLLDKWDFPYSELQNISLAPLDRLQLNMFEIQSAPRTLPRILGYLPRFIEHKTDVDFVHGEFYSSSPYLADERVPFRKGIFANWVTPRSDYDSGSELRYLYIQPDSVDNIFEQLADSSQLTDQFLINCQLDIKCVHPLSVLGLPY